MAKKKTAQPASIFSRPKKQEFRIGSVDIPFNWLFVMIAGGAILFAVFAFVQRQQKAFAEDVADTVLRDLRAITSGASVAKGTSQAIDIPESDIQLVCTEECTCGMTIKTVTAMLKDNIVFGQNRFKGTKLILWAQDWSLPLRVTNFLFMTTPTMRYYFLHAPNSALKKSIQERVPDNIEVTYIEEGNLNPNAAMIVGKKIVNLGYDAVRFVMISDGTGTIPSCVTDESFKDADVSCVLIRPDKRTGGINNAYDVIIYDKKPSEMSYAQHSYRVVGETAAIAAIFADNSRQYECNLKKAYRRLSFIAGLIAERSQILSDANACQAIGYWEKQRLPSVPQKNPLEKLSDTAIAIGRRGLIENNLQSSTETGDTNENNKLIWNLQKQLKLIQTRNQDLLRMDCPLLY